MPGVKGVASLPDPNAGPEAPPPFQGTRSSSQSAPISTSSGEAGRSPCPSTRFLPDRGRRPVLRLDRARRPPSRDPSSRRPRPLPAREGPGRLTIASATSGLIPLPLLHAPPRSASGRVAQRDPKRDRTGAFRRLSRGCPRRGLSRHLTPITPTGGNTQQEGRFACLRSGVSVVRTCRDSPLRGQVPPTGLSMASA
jgi:hypothetical protein